MTKRFVFDPSIYHFTDTKTGKTYCEYNLDKVVDILNEQDKTIQKLETELCPLIHHDKLMSGLNKGQELYINELNGTIKKLQKENHKLKQTILYLIGCLECEVNMDLEDECQQLLGCSYKEAKEKYGGCSYDEINEKYVWK